MKTLPPCCQYCRMPITDGSSRYLHEKCVGHLKAYGYHVQCQAMALANYAAEQKAREGVEK